MMRTVNATQTRKRSPIPVLTETDVEHSTLIGTNALPACQTATHATEHPTACMLGALLGRYFYAGPNSNERLRSAHQLRQAARNGRGR